jgi:hypothetical protein
MIAFLSGLAIGTFIGSPLLYFVVARIMMEGMPWNWTRRDRN